MISVAKAHDAIAKLARPIGTEHVPLHRAAGRVLRSDALATLSQPPFAASAMDGYAIRAADKVPGRQLKVVGEVAAGAWSNRAIGSGEALRIFTGAPIPQGADTILIQEDADRTGDLITVRDGFDRADYVRPAGGDFAIGDALRAPRRLSPADIGLLAAMNQPQVTVSRQPVVAIVPTGDELVSVGQAPGQGQIIASSAVGVAALLEQRGADTRILPIAPDRTDHLDHVLALAAGADLVITLGGASVGDHDLVQSTAHGRGLELEFYKIRMRPGKPLICGTLGTSAFLGLPGNPVSSMVCARIFAGPLIWALQGLPYTPPALLYGQLAAQIGQNGGREHYMRAVAEPGPDGWQLTALKRQDSSLLSVLSDANALLIRQPHEAARPTGASVPFISMAPLALSS